MNFRPVSLWEELTFSCIQAPATNQEAPIARFSFDSLSGKSYIMSLPGLQLDAPVETSVIRLEHELKEGTEWRFEVAFGSTIQVQVRIFSALCSRSFPGLYPIH